MQELLDHSFTVSLDDFVSLYDLSQEKQLSGPLRPSAVPASDQFNPGSLPPTQEPGLGE
jgi:hypothetical protein